MDLRNLLKDASGGLLAIGLFSFALNILTLVQPIYLLQIYDRILPSASYDTLLFISIMAVCALALFGFLDAVRAVVASRIGARIEVNAGTSTVIAMMRRRQAQEGDVQPLRDLILVRNFVGGRGVLNFFDLPFVPLFVGILYLVHVQLFWIAVCGTAVLIAIAVANEIFTKRSSEESSRNSMAGLATAQSLARNADSLRAMGMVHDAVRIWGQHAARAVNSQDEQNWVNAVFSGVSRSLRLGLQLAILGFGCYLVLKGEMTAGMIFASSLVASRALQPIDQMIMTWRAFTETRRAWKRLKEVYREQAAMERGYTRLPSPKGEIVARDVVVFGDRSAGGDPILKRVSFGVRAGECVAIVGPSGGGKSTLLKTIVGATKPYSGKVTIDGSELSDWDPEQLGREVGYVEQHVELLPGTIKQYIARFRPDTDDASVVRAAIAAGAHEVVKKLPQGYDTLIGALHHQLSGGQRQRVALARAFFGDPKIIILDEPNSSLDAEGEAALAQALDTAKAAGATVIMVTQRRHFPAAIDKLLVLRDGKIENYGLKRDVLNWLMAQNGARPTGDNVETMPIEPRHTTAGGTAGRGTATTTSGYRSKEAGE